MKIFKYLILLLMIASVFGQQQQLHHHHHHLNHNHLHHHQQQSQPQSQQLPHQQHLTDQHQQQQQQQNHQHHPQLSYSNHLHLPQQNDEPQISYQQYQQQQQHSRPDPNELYLPQVQEQSHQHHPQHQNLQHFQNSYPHHQQHSHPYELYQPQTQEHSHQPHQNLQHLHNSHHELYHQPQPQQQQQQLPIPYEGTVKIIKGKIKDGKFTGDGYRSSYKIDPEQQIVHRQDQHIRIEGDDNEVTFVSRDSTSPLNSPYQHYIDESSRQMTPQSCQARSPLIEPSLQHNVPNLPPVPMKPSQNSDIETYHMSGRYNNEHRYESSLMDAIRQYWHEILGLCITSALFLNWLYTIIKRRWINMVRSAAEDLVAGESMISSTKTTSSHINNNNDIQFTMKSQSKDTASSLAHDSAYDDTVSPLSSCEHEPSSLSSTSSSKSSQSHSDESLNVSAPENLCQQKQQNPSVGIRQRSSTLKAEPIPIPRTQRNKSNSAGSKPSSLSNSLNKSDSQFISRYSSDFVSIRRLGRGGFGIVFEAKNTIDDCSYAIKRICLPLEEDARERVMREVRALAKLDHPGIVRYYNAWLEHPPEDWLKQHDANLGIVEGKKDNNIYSTGGVYNDKNDYSDCDSSEDDEDDSKNYCGDDDFDDILEPFGPFKKRINGRRKFLKNNSSSHSLDIVFEGSGSIRLMSGNDTEKNSSNDIRQQNQNEQELNEGADKTGAKISKQDACKKLKKQNSNLEKNDGDNIYSDGDDSEYIQFKPKGTSNTNMRPIYENSGDEISMLSQLSEPFSSTSSEDSDSSSTSANDFNNKYADNEQTTKIKTTIGGQNINTGNNAQKPQNKQDNPFGKTTNETRKVDFHRKNALNYQKELRLLNNLSLVENAQPQQTEKAYLYIQMQLCHKETLKDWLISNCESRDKTEIFDLFYQIADAVDYVHSQDLIHRDLKPSNIFFSQDRTTVKIGDFGLCRARTGSNVGAIGSSLDLQEHAGESEVMKGFENMHTEQVGTQLYMSPEQLNGLSYNQKVDIFAMGLILLELLTPFKTQMQRVSVLFKARNNLYSEEFRSRHAKEHELVKSLLNRSPQKRPTATEIKQHDLLAGAQLSQPVMERINGHRRRTISSNSSTE